MLKNLTADERLIVALDAGSLKDAEFLIDKLVPAVKIFKVGLGLWTLYGPRAVELVHKKGGKVFLDLKFHDIPNTVSASIKAVLKLGVFMVNVHTLGGVEMMRQAVLAAREIEGGPKILGVTILTSMDQKAIEDVGIEGDVTAEVLRLAVMADRAGLDGVVASPNETALIRSKTKKDFIIVTPGVRPIWASKGDQKRIATPVEAVRAGADYIVVGRPIIEAEDSLQAARRIIEEMRN